MTQPRKDTPLSRSDSGHFWRPDDEPSPFFVRHADALFLACERAIHAGRIDARSEIGDAALDYRQERDEMMSQTDSDTGQNVCRLHRWERFTGSDGGRREVTVDHRQALADALLGYDVPTSDVLREFERLVTDSNYEL